MNEKPKVLIDLDEYNRLIERRNEDNRLEPLGLVPVLDRGKTIWTLMLSRPRSEVTIAILAESITSVSNLKNRFTFYVVDNEYGRKIR